MLRQRKSDSHVYYNSMFMNKSRTGKSHRPKDPCLLKYSAECKEQLQVDMSLLWEAQ